MPTEILKAKETSADSEIPREEATIQICAELWEDILVEVRIVYLAKHIVRPRKIDTTYEDLAWLDVT